MQINTSRLQLRDVREKDLLSVHQLNSIPEVDQYNTLGIPENIKVTRALISGWLQSINADPFQKYVLVIEDNQNEFIGLFGINMGKPNYKSAEIWYKLLPDHWNKGYATEVVKEILRFCFNDLKLHRIEAGCATGNIGSIQVLEKAGFIREGLKRKILPIRGEWVDNYFYSILEEDFLGK